MKAAMMECGSKRKTHLAHHHLFRIVVLEGQRIGALRALVGNLRDSGEVLNLAAKAASALERAGKHFLRGTPEGEKKKKSFFWGERSFEYLM